MWWKKLKTLFIVQGKKWGRCCLLVYIKTGMLKVKICTGGWRNTFKDEVLFRELVRVNKRCEDLHDFSLLDNGIVLMWSRDLLSVLNYTKFSVSINYPSLIHYKTSQEYLSNASECPIVFLNTVCYCFFIINRHQI